MKKLPPHWLGEAEIAWEARDEEWAWVLDEWERDTDRLKALTGEGDE